VWTLNPFVSHQRRAELSEQPAMIQSYSNEVMAVFVGVSLPGMDTPCRVLIIASLVLISTACGVHGDKGSMPANYHVDPEK